MRKANDGFTLIELVVGILCAALVTGAAMSLLLMGARSNRALADANSEQQTARILMSLVETLASEGSIGTVETVGDPDDGNQDWTLFDSTNVVPILYYSASAGAIRTQDGSNLMTGVIASSVTLSDRQDTITGRLLSFSIETEDDAYETSVFCRMSNLEGGNLELNDESITITDGENVLTPESDSNIVSSAGRYQLLEILCTQYGSTGEIKNSSPTTYYSEWYLQQQGLGYGNGWDKDTPWCACFLSWAVAQLDNTALNRVPYFATVDDGWQSNQFERYTTQSNNITPGDFIFFSWDDNPDTLEHVGVVFYVDSQWVYTIEGNSSGTVALRRYLLNDTSIVGYGILDWKTNDEI